MPGPFAPEAAAPEKKLRASPEKGLHFSFKYGKILRWRREKTALRCSSDQRLSAYEAYFNYERTFCYG